MDAPHWPKRLVVLDVSRGLASLIVVIWHWQHFAFQGDALPQGFDRSVQPFYFVLRIFYEKGLMGVNYFFLLSGFIFFWLYRSSIENRDISFKDFWVQRISRLYPLHFLTLLMVALLQWVYISHVGNSFVYPYNDVYHFVLQLGFAGYWGFEKGLSFNNPSWSVSIEILLYMLFFIGAYFRKGKGVFCVLISAIFFAISIFISPNKFEGFAAFYFGGFVFHLTLLLSKEAQSIKRMIYSAAILSWVLTMTNFYVMDLGGFIEKLGLGGKVLLLGFPIYILFPLTICSLALIEIDKGQFLKPISWVGDITYSSYLLHFPLQIIFGLAVGYGVLNADFYLSPLWFILFFAILIPLSYFSFVWFEHPLQNKIRTYYKLRAKPA